MLHEMIEELTKDLNLEYHYVMHSRRAIQIILSLASLTTGVLCLAKGTTLTSFTGGVALLAFFLRINYGPVMHRQLTPESQTRLNEFIDQTFGNIRSSDTSEQPSTPSQSE